MCVHAYLLSCVCLFVIPSSVVHQAFPFMGFPRQGYCGVVISFSRYLPNPGTEPTSSTLEGCFFTTELGSTLAT